MSVLDVVDFVALVLLFLASVLCLVAAVGLVRFPDLLSRMHAVTKPQVLGTLLALLGMGLALRDVSVGGVLVLVGLFQLVTVPITSHMMSRAALRANQVYLQHDGRDVVVGPGDQIVEREDNRPVLGADDDAEGSARQAR